MPQQMRDGRGRAHQLGEMEWNAGNESEGRALLERFLDDWGEADWELPQVAAARARLGG